MRDDTLAGNVTAPPDDPAAIPLEYVPIPVGPDGSTLIAHDRHRLLQVAARALVPARTLRVGSLPLDASVVAQIESKAVRRQRGLRRNARARQWTQLIAAAGLPFLVAALLGLLALPLRSVSVVGDAVADFVGTAGGSVGGLPLAAVITLLPSAWLIRRARRVVAARPAARGAETALRVAALQVRDDAGPFLAAADTILADVGDLLGGRARIDGQRALRLATRFDRLKRLAAHYDVAAVQAFAADMAAQFRQAGRPPRRLLPGLYARRNSVHIAAATSPYDPASRRRVSALLSLPALVLLGGVAALFTFLAAGVFRLSADDALILVPNEAVAFPSSATVLALGRGFDGADNPSADNAERGGRARILLGMATTGHGATGNQSDRPACAGDADPADGSRTRRPGGAVSVRRDRPDGVHPAGRAGVGRPVHCRDSARRPGATPRTVAGFAGGGIRRPNGECQRRVAVGNATVFEWICRRRKRQRAADRSGDHSEAPAGLQFPANLIAAILRPRAAR